MGTVTVTPANGYSRRGMSGYRAVGVAAAPAYNYAALYTTLGATGWVLHGGAGRSNFFEDSAGTVPCTTDNVSPVGRVTDISGNSNHSLQTMTSDKPVYRTSGGVRWFNFGATGDGAPGRHFDPTTKTYSTTAQTHIYLWRQGTYQSSASYGPLISSNGGGWGTGGLYNWVRHVFGTSNISFTSGGPNDDLFVTSNGAASPTIIVAKRTGLGTNESTISTYNLNGTLISTATGTNTGNPTDWFLVGYSGGQPYSQANCGFHMYAGAALSAQQITDVIADISSSFAGATL